MNDVTWWLLIAMVFALAASLELAVRLLRGISMLRSLKDWFLKLLDTLSGGL